jgi:hypothetical protein
MKRIIVTAVAVIALLALPSIALANNSSTCSAYKQQTCQVVDNQNTGSADGPTIAATPVDASTGSLPFTGLDIGLLAAGGVVLVGAGLAVRRLSTQR